LKLLKSKFKFFFFYHNNANIFKDKI